MSRFYFVLVGNNILLDRAGADPVVGFVARRSCKAASQADAEKRVKIELLQSWKQTFNTNNKAGTPTLDIVFGERIRNPLKKVRPSADFEFFSSNSERDQLQVEATEAVRHWFLIK